MSKYILSQNEIESIFFLCFQEYTSIEQVPEEEVPGIVLSPPGSTTTVKKCAGIKCFKYPLIRLNKLFRDNNETPDAIINEVVLRGRNL